MGELVLGKKIGNKAMLWGGFAGTIPDLDVLLVPFIDDLGMITIHRGISHSLIFAFLMAPILAWFVWHWYRVKPRQLLEQRKGSGFLKRGYSRFIDWFTRSLPDTETPSYRNWVWLFFLGLFTHPILDSFTVYGTQLFLPFSDYRVGLNNIFIVDPLYTLPFLLCLLIASRLRRTNSIRPWINYIGIGLSCAYIGLTLFNKYTVNQVFEKKLAAENITYKRYLTAPTPLNNVLWYCVAEKEDGYLLGYYSLLDQTTDNIDFTFMPRNEALIAPLTSSYAVDRLLWFSNGYYVMQEKEGDLYLHDVKYGKAGIGDQAGYVFSFKVLSEENGEVQIKQVRELPEQPIKEFLGLFWERLKGNKL